MKWCIYCKKTEYETIFSPKKGDHIIPKLLGEFDLYFGDDTVCQSCNNKISKSEGIFKEGSLAGVHSAVYGIDEKKHSSIKLLKDRINWDISSEDGEIGVFKDTFPLVDLAAGQLRPKSIIILDHEQSKTKHILFAEKYHEYAEKKNSEFISRQKKIREFKEKFGKLDISLFGDTKCGWTIEKMIALLNAYGLSYNEKISEMFTDKDRGKKITVKFTENGDEKTLKTPAKIAFNYFAFCARVDGMINILKHENFDAIRNYVLLGILPAPIYKPSFNYDNDPENKNGYHILTFQKEGEFITSHVSLFGRFNYKITLGRYPFSIQTDNFGCATAFDPFSKQIIHTIYSTPQPAIGRKRYGLFCR